VNYEDLVADKAKVIRSVVELLGVQNDEPEEIRPPIAERQGDETNIAWAARFRREHDLPPIASIG
jgi:LPS sulfotransferase NodH